MKEIDHTHQHYSELIRIIRFLHTLSSGIYGATDESAIFETIKCEFMKFPDYMMCVALFTTDKEYLKVRSLSVEENESILKQCMQITGTTLDSYCIDIRNSSIFDQVFTLGKTIDVSVHEILKELFPLSKASALINLLHYEDRVCVITPLVIAGEISGAFVMSSCTLVKFFLPFVTSFARHISMAIELVKQNIKKEEKEHEYRLLLRKKNIALKEILDQIKQEKQEIERSVVENVNKLIIPLLHELENRTGNSRDILKLIKRNLGMITSPYGRQISLLYAKLSRRELEICTMVKNGLSNKEIARSLGLSLLTVEKHRHRIRKKLGITHEKVNLTTFLQTL